VLRQLGAYFRDPRFRFDLPMESAGTPFQRRVWEVLRAIPSGETRTYGALAAELGTSPRAVGGACRANPVPLVVPCHRVVAADGLGGFSGATAGPRLAAKRWLLVHEGSIAEP
jgi:methylated-DNA-[protein]-cysteine S-methyltransferase